MFIAILTCARNFCLLKHVTTTDESSIMLLFVTVLIIVTFIEHVFRSIFCFCGDNDDNDHWNFHCTICTYIFTAKTPWNHVVSQSTPNHALDGM